MTDSELAALGIAVSVGLFLFGYRRTEGARKVRVTAANVDLERILVRRIVVDKYIPKEIDISRLTEGKARDHRVRATDLLSTDQLLNAAYTRVVESDLIPSDQREEILNRIEPVLAQSEAKPVQEETLEEIAASRRISRARDASVFAMAASATVLGALVSVAPEISTLGTEILESSEFLLVSAATAVASLALISFIYIATRLRTRQEERSKPSGLSRYLALEGQVRETLQHFGAIKSSSSRYIDYLFDFKDRLFAIEIKAWPENVPRTIISRTVERLRQAAEQTGAAETIIVTLESTPALRQVADSVGVKAFTVKELKSYLERSGS